MLCPCTHIMYIQDPPRETAVHLGAPTSVKLMHLQLGTPFAHPESSCIFSGRQIPRPLSYFVKFRVSLLKCLHSVLK